MPLTVSHYVIPAPIEGRTYLGRAASIPEGVQPGTIAPSVPRCLHARRKRKTERREEGEESHRQKERSLLSRDRDGEEKGVTSRRDAVGMFSQEKITCNHCERPLFRRKEYTYPQRSVSSIVEIIGRDRARSRLEKYTRLVLTFRIKEQIYPFRSIPKD